MHILSLFGLLTTLQFKFVSLDKDNGFHCSTEDLEKLLKTHKIIPDLLTDVPKQCLYVEMNGKILKPGSGVDHLDTLEEPNKIKWNYENGTLYSFVMTGLDVPTQEDPHDRESQHWIVGNIPGNNITAGDKYFSFEPAGIEYGEGIHRVVFLVFKQSMPIEFADWHPQIREDSIYRAHFSTKQFSEKYKLGLPIAVNFYEFDIDQ